jgi:hypothetical protein
MDRVRSQRRATDDLAIALNDLIAAAPLDALLIIFVVLLVLGFTVYRPG